MNFIYDLHRTMMSQKLILVYQGDFTQETTKSILAMAERNIDSSGEEFCLTLVYPKDVDATGDKISILAPVGSALLGLATGDEIDWPRPGGGRIKV